MWVVLSSLGDAWMNGCLDEWWHKIPTPDCVIAVTVVNTVEGIITPKSLDIGS